MLVLFFADENRAPVPEQAPEAAPAGVGGPVLQALPTNDGLAHLDVMPFAQPYAYSGAPAPAPAAQAPAPAAAFLPRAGRDSTFQQVHFSFCCSPPCSGAFSVPFLPQAAPCTALHAVSAELLPITAASWSRNLSSEHDSIVQHLPGICHAVLAVR